MKTKFFLAAAMVAFSFAMVSCGGNKTANSDAAADSTSVAVEAAESAKIKLRAIRKQSALRKKIVQKKLAIRNNQQVATV